MDIADAVLYFAASPFVTGQVLSPNGGDCDLTDGKEENMKRYTWLLFDADGTLLDFPLAERTALREALAAQNLAADETVIATYSAINDAIWKQIETGTFDRANLNAARFSQLAWQFGFDCDVDRLGRDYFAAMAQQASLLMERLTCALRCGNVIRSLSSPMAPHRFSTGGWTVRRCWLVWTVSSSRRNSGREKPESGILFGCGLRPSPVLTGHGRWLSATR